MRNWWRIDAAATIRKGLSAALSSQCLVFAVQRPPASFCYHLHRHYTPPYFSRPLAAPPSLHCLSCQRHVGVITLRRRILEKRSLLGEAVASMRKKVGCSCANSGQFRTENFKATRKASPNTRSIMRRDIDISLQFLSLPCF